MRRISTSGAVIRDRRYDRELRCGVALFVALLAGAVPAVAQFGAVGLSAVRGQRFGNDDLGSFFPETGDQLGATLIAGDFSGDGADELIIGVPGDGNVDGAVPGSGIVLIETGVAGAGLTGGFPDALLSQMASGAPDPAEEDDRFGSAFAVCDLDADGDDDLAVGIPDESIGSAVRAGAVQIHLGSPFGLSFVADLFLTQDTPGIPGGAGFIHELGRSLACADYDGDGFADLAIGVPFEPLTVGFAGMVIVVPGSSAALDPAASYVLHQDLPGFEEHAEMFEEFGATLATGDFDGDLFADLAIGVPGESDAGGPACGAVHVVYGSAGGLAAPGDRLLREADFALTCGTPAGFGDALASGDFDGDGRDDLLIGLPRKSFGGNAIFEGGQVIAVYGGADGLDPLAAQVWVENSIHGTGATEANDRFGSAFATGDFDADGFDDAAIGHPGEFQLVAQDGAVTVLSGSANGLTAARRHGLAAGQLGLPGVANRPDRHFGAALASGDFDGDGHADLAIGAPDEDENGLADVGAAVVLYGSLFADGFETNDTGFWASESP